MHGRGFGIVKGGTSDIPEFEVPEFEVKETLEFVVPQPRLSYRNRRTPRNCIYTGQSEYQSTRDLRLCSEQLNELCKIHEKMLATGDGKTWNIAYKNLINRLADVMEVADIVVEHKNDIFNLQNFLTLPLNLLATDLKIVPIFVQIITWELKKVIIEEHSQEASSLRQEAKKTFGRKFKVMCEDVEAIEFAPLFPAYPTFSSTFSGNGKCLLSFCNPLATRVNATFLGKCRDRMHGRGFGIVKGGSSDIPEFEVPEFEVKEI
ncbi:hypothetical protein L3X38_029634 [Prunus dulcis]|uniref:Uncharacterized protein n=1 Tax=Prunus dulcis TaxID=3755 RepID=A0AAD4VSZ4_PRUDU|nr:hypothetical protein L3X38_029634 [Prunus dulcis]